MLGAHYGQSTRRIRGRLVRSHSVCDTTTNQQQRLVDMGRASSQTEADPGHGEAGGLRKERVRRPTSARRFRLTSSFDDGCSGRERVSVSISSTTSDITSTISMSFTGSENTGRMYHFDRQSDVSTGRDQSQKHRLRSSPVARAANSTSSSCDQPRSNALPDETKRQKESGIKNNRSASKPSQHTATAKCSAPSIKAKKIPNIGNEKDTTSLKRPPARASVPVRRTSLDMKSQDSDKVTNGKQSTTQRPRNLDQRNSKAGVNPSGTASANSSSKLMRCDQLHFSANHKARY